MHLPKDESETNQMEMSKATDVQIKAHGLIMHLTDLRMGDQVMNPDNAGLGILLVKKVTDQAISFFRPYATNFNYSYTGGIICLTGIEEWDCPLTYNTNWLVISRQDIH